MAGTLYCMGYTRTARPSTHFTAPDRPPWPTYSGTSPPSASTIGLQAGETETERRWKGLHRRNLIFFKRYIKSRPSIGSSEPARSGKGEFISSVAGRYTVVLCLFLSTFHSLPRHYFSHVL